MERYFNSNSVYIKDGNQEQMILNYIKEHGSITNIEAVYNLGIAQCPARIFGLKRKGVNIATRKKKVVDRYNQSKTVVEYYIKQEGEVV